MIPATVSAPAVPALDRTRVRTLADLYGERLRLAPHAEACRHFDARSQSWRSLSWAELAASAQGYAAGLRTLGLKPGERIAIQIANGPDWLALDWAAHSLGLVSVGLFADETPAGTAQLLDDSEARALFVRDLASWGAVTARSRLASLNAVVAFRGAIPAGDRRIRALERFQRRGEPLAASPAQAQELASLVYTSGATGRPKGVMLTHENLVANAFAVQDAMRYLGDDLLFSNLPLAHLYGRVACVYAGIVAGATIVFGRGAGFVAEDLSSQKPSVLIGAPRLYERIHGALAHELEAGSATRRALFRLAVEAGWAAQRKDASRLKVRLLPTVLARRAGDALRARLGGRVRLAVSGGAALSPQIARVFTALGIPLLQGYGLTEAGPVVSANRVDDHDPASVGHALDGVETRIEANGELLVRGPSVMRGYWKDEAGTRAVLDADGWLRTGDKVSRLDTDRIYLVGRFKELLVTATGEKASPADIEARLRELPLVEQVMVVGEARPYLTALIVPQPGPLAMLRAEIGLNDGDDSPAAREAIESALLHRCQDVLRDAPRNHWIVGVSVVHAPWTPNNGLLTATHKLRRCEIARVHAEEIERLYEGHYTVPATDCSSNATL
jgi:long-chain acyl-CoA synthetase